MSTELATRPCATLHSTGKYIKDMFNAVLAHVATGDSEHHVLRQMHIEVKGGYLHLVASDKYTLGIARVRLTATDSGPEVRLAVDSEVLRSAIAFADEGAVELAVMRDRLRIASPMRTQEIFGEDSALPWRGIVSKILAAPVAPTESVVVDPRFFARLEAARPLVGREAMRFFLRGETSALCVTVGDSFLAMIMPARPGESSAIPAVPLDAWRAICDRV